MNADEAPLPPDPHQPAEHPPGAREEKPGGEAAAPSLVGPTGGPPNPDYPVKLEIDYPERLNRWLPLVKWLLAIPHYIVLMLLGIGAFFAIVISWFAVILTRTYPRGLFDFVVGVYRYGIRVAAYLLLLTDRYPPFALSHDPDYPVRFDIAYPDKGVDRWRPLIQWLLGYPYVLAASVLLYLGYLLVFFAFFTILFTKRFPKGMFDIVTVALRWSARGYSYSYWLATRYPPFVWA